MQRGGDTINLILDAPFIGDRLDRALALAVPSLSRERIKALLGEGAVAADGQIVRRASAKIVAPTAISISLPIAKPASAQAQMIALSIAYEDEHLIVIDKPAGMVVHPASGNPDGTLVNALLHHCAGQLSGIGGVARPGIVHRIDKDTSGLIVAAKTNAAHEGLAKQFFDHSIERIYQCIVNGVPLPPVGTIDAALARSPYDRKKIAITSGPRGKRAVTHFRMIQALNNAALVECRLETGRTHQVRVHMAHNGHSLIGDPVYGHSARHAALLKALGFKRQALHAAKLGFIHPVTGQTVTCQSQMPNDMQDLFTRLTL
ncbi:MAG: RluA family pseudouridine synthase [Sphingopyxis sp.]